MGSTGGPTFAKNGVLVEVLIYPKKRRLPNINKAMQFLFRNPAKSVANAFILPNTSSWYKPEVLSRSIISTS